MSARDELAHRPAAMAAAMVFTVGVARLEFLPLGFSPLGFSPLVLASLGLCCVGCMWSSLWFFRVSRDTRHGGASLKITHTRINRCFSEFPRTNTDSLEKFWPS